MKTSPAKNHKTRFSDRHFQGFIFVGFTLIWSLFIHSRAYSANDASRMATIDSLVTRQTWVIDDSLFQTIDRIQVDGQFVSDKPPMLPFIGAGVYAILHHGFGLTLQANSCNPDATPTHCRTLWEPNTADWAYFILTLFLISTPATLILILMFKLARQQGWSQRNGLLFVTSLGLGTALFPYSVVFTNHVPAAAAIFVAFYLLLTHQELTTRQLMGVGFAAAIAFTIDLSAGIFLAAFAIYLLWHYRQKAICFVIGSLIPLALFALLNYQIVGNIFPPQLFAEGYQYEGSPFLGNVAGNQQASNVVQYAYRLLVGDQGVFAFYPLLIWFLLTLIHALRHEKGKRQQLAWLVTVSTVAYVAYFVLSTDNFGGKAYSPRWLLMPVPLLAIFAIINIDIYRPMWRVGFVAGLALISIAGTYQGALNPWQSAQPIFHLAYNNSTGDQFIPVAISGYAEFEDIDVRIQQSLGDANLQIRWFDAPSGLVIPTDISWWFIGETTPLAPELATLLGLKMASPYLFQGDLTNLAEEAVADFNKEVFQSETLFPQPNVDHPVLSLPITFAGEDGRFSLQGYKWQQQQGEGILITAWQIETHSQSTPRNRRIFVHLLAENGDIVQQSDTLSVNYGSLLSGDRFFQVQKLPLHTLPAGEYWLQIGVYQPNNGLRILTDGGEARLLIGKVTVP